MAKYQTKRKHFVTYLQNTSTMMVKLRYIRLIEYFKSQLLMQKLCRKRRMVTSQRSLTIS